MKKVKIIFGALAALLLMSGCWRGDPDPTTIYVYVNNTAWNLSVTINISIQDSSPMEFNIAQGESYYLRTAGVGDNNQPLCGIDKAGRHDAYSIMISNGESLVECYRTDNGDIYQLEKYTLVSSTESTNTYRFTIEPDFFDNAAPIE